MNQKQCANFSCDTKFTPRRNNHLYCSENCRVKQRALKSQDYKNRKVGLKKTQQEAEWLADLIATSKIKIKKNLFHDNLKKSHEQIITEEIEQENNLIWSNANKCYNFEHSSTLNRTVADEEVSQ